MTTAVRSASKPAKHSRCEVPGPVGSPSRVLHEALRLRDDKITAEHVLLGTLRNEHGQAPRLLAGMGIPAREVEERLNRLRS